MAENPSKLPRSFLRFSLRALLLLTFAIAVPLGWKMNSLRKKRLAVTALEQMGCQVVVEDASGGLESLLQRWGEGRATNVSDVFGDNSQINDAGLIHLRGLSQLDQLSLNHTQVTDAALVHVQGLTEIRILRLAGTQVTDAGLLHLRNLTQLVWLDLDETAVTDNGLACLRGLTALLELDLAETAVTDAGLMHLGTLTLLESLSLHGTRVTDAGVRQLQAALPNCEINH